MLEYTFHVDNMTPIEFASSPSLDDVDAGRAVQFAFTYVDNGNSQGINMVYFGVGGQVHAQGDEHVNVESYYGLPTIDYIYDVNVPASNATAVPPATGNAYEHTRILPYFIHGSTGQGFTTVNQLKLFFAREKLQGPNGNYIQFAITGEREAAWPSSVGSQGGRQVPLLDYIDKRNPLVPDPNTEFQLIRATPSP